MNRFAALDGLRGIAALAVAFFHLPLAFHLFPSALFREAYIFVDFFFVLSGFVIAHAYGARLTDGAQLGDFLVRRVGRLWPLHLATLAVLVALECLRYIAASRLGAEVRVPFSGETALSQLLPNALLLHAWGLGVLSWNVPSWSISAELFAYVVFGLVVVLSRSRMVAVSALIAALAWSASVLIATDPDLYSNLGSLRAICGFFAGVLVHAAFTRSGRPDWTPAVGTVLELAATALVAGFLMFVSRHELTPWAMPVFAFALYVFAAERGALSSLLKSRPLQLLGTLSYSIYLTHSLVITAFNAGAKLIGKLVGTNTMVSAMDVFPGIAHRNIHWDIVSFGNLWLNDLYGLTFAAAVIGLSALTYRFIELPGQRLFAGFASRRRLSSAPAH